MDFVASINLHASQLCAIAAVRFTMDLETVADSISNAFVGVVEATDVRCATISITWNGALADGRDALLLALPSVASRSGLTLHPTRRTPYYNLCL